MNLELKQVSSIPYVVNNATENNHYQCIINTFMFNIESLSMLLKL